MRYLFPLVLVFTALALGIYAYLGGLHTPTTAFEASVAPVLLAGQPYLGPASANAFGQLFRQAKTLHDSGQLPTAQALANAYYNDPAARHDSVRAFVGVRVADTTARLPAGWRYQALPAGRRLHAHLQGVSFLLAPGKLYDAAESSLKSQGLAKQFPVLEQFGDDETSDLWLGVAPAKN